jgi:hypothetical protein
MSHAITTTTSRTVAAQRAPRVKKVPSARDLEIYKRVKIQGFLQWEVAQDHELHYSRVAQIIKRVERWLASGGDPIDPQIRDHAARQRLAKGMHKLRLARGIEIASMALEFNQPVTTTRRRVQGSTELWREETSREVPKVNLGALRLLVDATQALHQVELQEQSAAAQSTDRELLCMVFDLLCTWRARAEAQDTVRRVTDIPALVSECLFKLLGPQTADLGDRMPRIAQEAFLRPKAPVPTAQSPLPSAQEPLNLSPSSDPSLATNAIPPTTSVSQQEKTTSQLEPFPLTPSVSEGRGHGSPHS